MHNPPKILISGFYCGPSPSAGLGIAKSIRTAWPSATIIGMDYWNGSSGLHDECLTERLVFPSWDLLDYETHKRNMMKFSEDTLIISALDVEIAWMRKHLDESDNLLIPSKKSLFYADKPEVKIGDFLPFKRPKIKIDHGDDQELFDFCREQSWRIWVKGPFHGATFVRNWAGLAAARQAAVGKGNFRNVSYQQHIRGTEESICFAAINGKLIDAVHMQKRITTSEGKTWSGKISALSDSQRSILSHAIAKIDWTGGGELELIRDEADQYWLMEFNPRFPAWIYGATIAGHNLPALLVQAKTGSIPSKPAIPISAEFTRVVTEMPVLRGISLPKLTQPSHGDVGSIGKYGASYGNLEDKLFEDTTDAISPSFKLMAPEPETNDWINAIRACPPTPYRVRLDPVIRSHLKNAADLMKISHGNCNLQVAYSIKTCPDPFYLNQAFANGLWAEAISMAEVEAALEAGWAPEQIVLNGPAKWWPRTMTHHQGLGAVYCDSSEELERLLQSGRKDKLWGLRLKIPGFESRFGIDLTAFEELSKLVMLIRQIPRDIELGFHLHLASNILGNGHWQDAVDSAISWANSLAAQAKRPISIMDFGGGYHPRDFLKFDWQNIVKFTKKRSPSIRSVFIEPGRALSQDTMLMVTTIQDVRKEHQLIKDVVVDTCIAELPLSKVYPHRMYLFKNDQLIPLGIGKSRILGRICMEDDILADSVDLPPTVNIGDRIIIADAGAYERSMSYEFGYGRLGQSY
jgi:diaminopimelate decarboxylase